MASVFNVYNLDDGQQFENCVSLLGLKNKIFSIKFQNIGKLIEYNSYNRFGY